MCRRVHVCVHTRSSPKTRIMMLMCTCIQRGYPSHGLWCVSVRLLQFSFGRNCSCVWMCYSHRTIHGLRVRLCVGVYEHPAIRVGRLDCAVWIWMCKSAAYARGNNWNMWRVCGCMCYVIAWWVLHIGTLYNVGSPLSYKWGWGKSHGETQEKSSRFVCKCVKS